MGWFKKTFGFSSQDALKNLAKNVWDTVYKPTEVVLDLFNANKWNPLPSWDELQRPGQFFANRVDTINSALLPDKWEKYALPLETMAISAVNPYAGAALNTAYNAGKMQETQKGLNLSNIGKDAIVNFGTAAIADWAKNIKPAQTAPKISQSNSMLGEGFNAQTISGPPRSALSRFSPSELSQDSTYALEQIGLTARPTAQEAIDMASFAPGLRSTNRVPIHQAQASGGFSGPLKTVTREITPKLATEALTATLAPEKNMPISGMEIINQSIGATPKNQYGDIFRAFGSSDMIIPDNKGGYTIDPEAAARGYQAIAANDWLQRNMRRDQFIPAGQIRSAENTPYEKQLTDIAKSTQQYYKDFEEQLRQAAMTKALMSANPWLTQDQIIEFTEDPNKVPETMRPFFKQLKPIFY